MGGTSGKSVGDSVELVVEKDERAADSVGASVGASVGDSVELVVEKDERGVVVPSPGRTLYDNEGKWQEIGIVRCCIFVASPN